MSLSFFHIHNYNNTVIAYCRVNDINQYYALKWHLNQPIDYRLYLLYFFQDSEGNMKQIDQCANENITLIQCFMNCEPFFYLHLLRHNYFYKKGRRDILENPNILLEIYNKINVDNGLPKFEWNINNNKQDIDFSYISKKISELDIDPLLASTKIEKMSYYCERIDHINDLLITNIPDIESIICFKEFMELYAIKPNNRLFSIFKSTDLVLENVYYINKCWFDGNRHPLHNVIFNSDIEYGVFEKTDNAWNHHVSDITNYPIHQSIDEEIVYLDYIYGYYNFGEFWDCIRRLLAESKKPLPLFHVSNSRVTNIEYYFKKLGFNYPTKYQTQEGNNKLYYFNKIHVSIINGGCRGYYDKYIAYQFNRVFNPNSISETKSYNIYLARGPYGRSLLNESNIVNTLKAKYGFVIIDGSESLETIMQHFTNANIILGVHGSLMKNTIWCKKNPVFIELCPNTRHGCFQDNAMCCNFTTFFFICDCNEKEEVVLGDEKENALYGLLDILV